MSTPSNLNAAAAQSRIQDTDYARETAAQAREPAPERGEHRHAQSGQPHFLAVRRAAAGIRRHTVSSSAAEAGQTKSARWGR